MAGEVRADGPVRWYGAAAATVDGPAAATPNPGGATVLLIKSARKIAQHFPARAGEWFLAFGLLLWGLVVSLPSDAFNAPSLRHLLVYAPERAWAIGAVLTASVRLAFLILNGAWRRSPHLRAIGAFCAECFWVNLAISAVYGASPTTGLAILPMLAMFDAFNFVRAITDARRADDVAAARRALLPK